MLQEPEWKAKKVSGGKTDWLEKLLAECKN